MFYRVVVKEIVCILRMMGICVSKLLMHENIHGIFVLRSSWIFVGFRYIFCRNYNFSIWYSFFISSWRVWKYSRFLHFGYFSIDFFCMRCWYFNIYMFRLFFMNFWIIINEHENCTIITFNHLFIFYLILMTLWTVSLTKQHKLHTFNIPSK